MIDYQLTLDKYVLQHHSQNVSTVVSNLVYTNQAEGGGAWPPRAPQNGLKVSVIADDYLK